MTTTKKISQGITSSFITMLDTSRSAAKLSAQVFRKPLLIKHWLLSARAAQITCFVFALLMPSIIPGLVDKTYPEIATPEPPQGVVEKFSSIIQRIQGNDEFQQQIDEYKKKSERREMIINGILWSGSGIIVLMLLWLHIP